MHLLNDLELIGKIDKSKMLERLLNFPYQYEMTERLVRDIEFPFFAEEIKSMILSGMGGSALGGDILISYLKKNLKIPAIVNRNYFLPRFVDEKTLVIVISYSGNTEETLTSLNDAYEKRSKLVAITSGGSVEEFCSERNIPLIKIIGGLQPRESLGYIFFILLALMEKSRFIEGQQADISETIELLKTLSKVYSSESSGAENVAKSLSLDIHGKIPLLYGIQDLTDSIALRWKCQFNENSKIPSFYNIFPELDHNEIEGWDTDHSLGNNFFVIILRSLEETENITRQIEITKQIITDKVGGIREVWGKGNGRLARIFSLIYLGDFISLYLAILNGVDPTPVKNIERLKKQLSAQTYK
ncbi:MAG: bifunctional phosphoglucose/phosphomannose isomerase [Nitrospinota bacterium]